MGYVMQNPEFDEEKIKASKEEGEDLSSKKDKIKPSASKQKVGEKQATKKTELLKDQEANQSAIFIPNEILEKIILNVGDPSELYPLASVSHGLNSIVNSDLVRQNTLRKMGEFPLHYACSLKKSNISFVQSLINGGNDVFSKDRKGFMPIHYAIENKHIEICKLLLDNKPEQIKHLSDDDNKLLLKLAVDRDDVGLMALLTRINEKTFLEDAKININQKPAIIQYFQDVNEKKQEFFKFMNLIFKIIIKDDVLVKKGKVLVEHYFHLTRKIYQPNGATLKELIAEYVTTENDGLSLKKILETLPVPSEGKGIGKKIKSLFFKKNQSSADKQSYANLYEKIMHDFGFDKEDLKKIEELESKKTQSQNSESKEEIAQNGPQ